jgi:hypothetical protein
VQKRRVILALVLRSTLAAPKAYTSSYRARTEARTSDDAEAITKRVRTGAHTA